MGLKIARSQKGILQKDLRKQLNMSPNKLVQIEKGNLDNVTIGDLKRIADALGMPMQEVFPELNH